jgi:hypothetical protein
MLCNNFIAFDDGGCGVRGGGVFRGFQARFSLHDQDVSR